MLFLDKPIIKFCDEKKSIRKYVVRMDIDEANEQKKPKIMTPCSLCIKNCHLIRNDGTLKNIHNWKELKKLDEANCRTGNIIYGARCKRHSDISFWLAKITLMGEISARQNFCVFRKFWAILQK